MKQNKKKAPKPLQAPPPDLTSTGYRFVIDATGAPRTDLLNLLNDTAQEVTNAVPDPAQWPDLIAYLLACMENQRNEHHAIESSLDNICRLITKRLNSSTW